MTKFVISNIWNKNLLNLQRFCSRIFGVQLSKPKNNVVENIPNKNNNNVNENFSDIINEDNSNNNLIKTAKENISNYPVLPPITVSDIEDEYEDFEDFFDNPEKDSTVQQPFDKKIIQPGLNKLIKPIEKNILKLSNEIDDYDNNEELKNSNQNIDEIFDGDIIDDLIDAEINKAKSTILDCTNNSSDDSLTYNLINLNLSSDFISKDETINSIYLDQPLICDINGNIGNYNDNNIPNNINTTKLDDIVKPFQNIFLKNHHQPISVRNEICNDYKVVDDILENSDEKEYPKINDKPVKKDNISVELKEQGGSLSVKKEGILKYHLPPVHVGGEDDDQLLDDEPDEEEIMKRTGEYKSHGIKLFIPQSKMPAGTIRYQLEKLPDGMPDDIRVIHYD